MSTITRFQPDYAIHPGETLAETLEELGMSQVELAQRMGRPLQMISEIVQGKKAITAETALQLERATGVPANFWNSAQRNYEAAVARLAEERDLAPDSDWLDRFPLRALITLGHIPASGSPAEQMRALLNFFGVAGKKEWESIWTAPAVAFRKSTAFEANPMAVAAWLRLGERLAQQVRTEPYDQDRFIQSLHEIRKLTRAEPQVSAPQAIELCRASGVALVFVPELPATRVHGATRWLTPQKALLQLSLRGKTDDLLWFAFFHEAAHILKHGKREVFIEASNGVTDEETRRKELEADTFASDFLIPRNAFTELKQQRRLSTQTVQGFADKLGIAPSIVVGRLQHERLVPFTHLNALKRRLRLKDPTE
ncbi:MAG: HigA family addiction module antidote protein [Verrucomicrobiales bacterium]|nr:HigA family addiction module antidote protein [Verrucomicrobiales bacterium]